MSLQLKYFLTEEALAAGGQFTAPREGDAGYDIRSVEDVYIFKGEQKLVRTGLYLEIPHGYVGFIKDRSSMALKRYYTHGGVIDSSYRGELSVILGNDSEGNYHINAGDRIAQLVITAVVSIPVIAVDKSTFTSTERGDGGFGSTGR